MKRLRQQALFDVGPEAAATTAPRDLVHAPHYRTASVVRWTLCWRDTQEHRTAPTSFDLDKVTCERCLKILRERPQLVNLIVNRRGGK